MLTLAEQIPTADITIEKLENTTTTTAIPPMIMTAEFVHMIMMIGLVGIVEQVRKQRSLHIPIRPGRLHPIQVQVYTKRTTLGNTGQQVAEYVPYYWASHAIKTKNVRKKKQDKKLPKRKLGKNNLIRNERSIWSFTAVSYTHLNIDNLILTPLKKKRG